MTMPKNDNLGVGKSLVQLGGIGTPKLIAMCDDDRKTIQLELGYLRQLLPYLEAVAPGLLRRITGTPSGVRGTTDDFLYWSKADLGLKPIITLTHVAICTQGRGPNEVVIASRQIFANHYVDASLGLTALVDSSDGSSMSYLIYVNRSRIDRFPGPFGALARALVKSRIRKGVEKSLAIEKTRLERSRAGAPPAEERRHP